MSNRITNNDDKNSVSDKISIRIKELRADNNISQAELAKQLGISINALSHYERGLRLPTADIIYQMSRIFRASSDYLLGLSDHKTIEKASITNFSVIQYLESLAVVLSEMSTKFSYVRDNREPGEISGEIKIGNNRVAYFCKKFVDLLCVYRAGTLTKEMFVSCVENLIDNLKDCGFFGYAFLSEDVRYSAELSVETALLDISDSPNFKSPGTMSNEYGDFFLEQELINRILSDPKEEGEKNDDPPKEE